jgi:hypothetical protein
MGAPTADRAEETEGALEDIFGFRLKRMPP